MQEAQDDNENLKSQMNVPSFQDNVANIQGKRIISVVDLSKEWKELFPIDGKVPYICEKTS